VPRLGRSARTRPRRPRNVAARRRILHSYGKKATSSRDSATRAHSRSDRSCTDSAGQASDANAAFNVRTFGTQSGARRRRSVPPDMRADGRVAAHRGKNHESTEALTHRIAPAALRAHVAQDGGELKAPRGFRAW
jgi:hypothetical protein